MLLLYVVCRTRKITYRPKPKLCRAPTSVYSLSWSKRCWTMSDEHCKPHRAFRVYRAVCQSSANGSLLTCVHTPRLLHFNNANSTPTDRRSARLVGTSCPWPPFSTGGPKVRSGPDWKVGAGGPAPAAPYRHLGCTTRRRRSRGTGGERGGGCEGCGGRFWGGIAGRSAVGG